MPITLATPASSNTTMLPDVATQHGFVHLDEVDESIQVCLRYAGSENFLGRPAPGYNISDRALLTSNAAHALKRVQSAVKRDGYSLLVYDAYRPQRAVDEFLRWGENAHDITRKSKYYPHLSKTEVFQNGYVATHSGHSRGSTVDVTLVPLDRVRKHLWWYVASSPNDVHWSERNLVDGTRIPYLNDGSVDMGSSFDLFHEASHTFSPLIVDPAAREMRQYLCNAMTAENFINLPQEWWHFTLQNEPHPAHADDSYFDFAIQ
eukprot:m.128770 g.128770  ORF g.128770 m.128770 type:complete len:262 (-) comp17445_c0_seq1:10-795(-)